MQGYERPSPRSQKAVRGYVLRSKNVPRRGKPFAVIVARATDDATTESPYCRCPSGGASVGENEMIVKGASETRDVRPGHGDNSELRARLSGRASDANSIVAELRSAMLERE